MPIPPKCPKMLLLYRPKMVWTEKHDVLLCREILVQEPYKYKAGTRERGHTWDKIAHTFNMTVDMRFAVDQRGVREGHAKLEENFKRKMAAEERSSGISPQMTELDQAVESIIEQCEGAQEEIACADERRKNMAEKERETAESVRKRSMERLADTSERESQENGKKKRRVMGNETLEFLKEKSEKEIKMRREEIEIRKNEVELKNHELELREREHQARERKDEQMLAIMSQQQQQLHTVLLQMQQVNESISVCLNNIKEKIG